MATRKELIEAVAQRYRGASKSDRTKILDEFAELTKYHRKCRTSGSGLYFIGLDYNAGLQGQAFTL